MGEDAVSGKGSNADKVRGAAGLGWRLGLPLLLWTSKAIANSCLFGTTYFFLTFFSVAVGLSCSAQASL